MDLNETQRHPKVTVVVSAYNHEKYILECLEGIGNQSFRDFEWIVVDDGSSDQTPQILKDNQKKYGYQLIIQKNKGLSATLTMLYSQYAHGEYISGCASDDFWAPHKLELQVKFMDEHPEYAFCYGEAYGVDENSQIIGIRNKDKNHQGYVFDKIITKRFHPPVNRMTRLSVFKEMGYYPKGIIAEDFYMDCKITHKYPIGYIPELLSYYRVSPIHKKRDPYTLLKSHEDTIQLYKNDSVFYEAISRHSMISFVMLSPYKKYKKKSIQYLLKVRLKELSFPKLFGGIYNIIFKWISI